MSTRLSSEILWDTLNHPEVAANVQHMITIGTEEYHESAFAVYHTVGGIVVSEVVEPVIREMDVLDPYTVERHTQINTLPLTHQILENQRYYFHFDEVADAPLGKSARLTVDKILANGELQETEKQNLIQTVIDRDLKQTSTDEYVLRTDLLMVVHNHPQFPTEISGISKLLVPSAEDLWCHERLRAANPAAVEAIVASDATNHGLLLYTNDSADATLGIEYYDHVLHEVDNEKRRRAALRAAGFKWAIIKLQDSGQPAAGQLEVLQSFVAED